MRYDLAVYIGRFQPFHLGHLHAINKALEVADKVLILVGSSNSPRTTKNPWLYRERSTMIRESLIQRGLNSPYGGDPLFDVDAISDFPYNDTEWAEQVHRVVANTKLTLPDNPKICIVGHEKDDSSYYLKMFPQWKFIDTGFQEFEFGERRIDATKIRELFFRNEMAYAQAALPGASFGMINHYNRAMPEQFDALREEYAFIQKYKKQWEAAPYPPTFVTTDAIVVQAGHVLLVRRGANPGKGLLAMPGGFLDQRERVVDGCIRELVEETGIKLQEDVLRRCIVDNQVFDAPDRSTRGRTITHAFSFKLKDNAPLPKVKGGDDAASAEWMPIGLLREEDFYEDHYHVVKTMIKRLDQNR